MTDVNLDVTNRDDIFPGLSVKIKTKDGIIVEGIVKKILTLIAIDYQGIAVQLETDEIGKVIEVIQTASEIEYNNLASEFNKDITIEENQFLEYKETFAYPTDFELKDITKNDKKQVRFWTAKTIAAFANSYGGTLYIGVKDNPREVIGLDRDYQLLDDGHKTTDGLGIKMKSVLTPFFGRGSRIFESVNINFIKYNQVDICVVKVKPSYLAFIVNFDSKDHFFVRHDDSSQPYEPNQFLDYWPKHLVEIQGLQFGGQKSTNFVNPFITNSAGNSLS